MPPDPLANPVRLAIVQSLRSSSDATLDELAAAAGVHRNTVRVHAEALAKAGLLARAQPAPQAGAGRPRTRYRLTEAARRVDPPPLARLLASAVADAGLSQRQARRIGRSHAVRLERLTPRPRRIDELEDELAGLGFAAQVSKELIELEACPCPVVSPESPTVVCALVAGAVDGTLERTGSGVQVIDAEHDPAARRCTLYLGPTM